MSSLSSCRTGTAGRAGTRTLRLWASVGAIAGTLLGGQIPAVRAHIDPGVCAVTGVSIVLEAFRADRVTRISLSENVSDCEEVCFRTVLSNPPPMPGRTPGCAFEEGVLTITTPDGVVHDVTPAPQIPCLGGTTQDPTLTPPAGACTPSVTSVTSDFQCYVVTSPDAQSGSIMVRTAYDMGLSHSAPDNLPDLVSADTAILLEAEPMCPLDACNTGVCDPQTLRCIPVPDSTPCEDTDGESCTMAGCELTDAQAGTATCVQDHVIANNSTPCADTDGESCTMAGCEAGVCVQDHVIASDSTPCADTDGNMCTMAGCEAGACVQTHQVRTCPDDACNTGVCNPADGRCVPEENSTPCPDTDGSECTVAGCEPTAPDADTAVCVQTHVVAENSTPCADTDGSMCTTAGCEAGVCVQTHFVKMCPEDECNTGVCNPMNGRCVIEPDSTPCADTDGNVCTIAGCEPTGIDTAECFQVHAIAENSTPCPDTDGSMCTTAGCEVGECVQTHVVKECPQDACNTGVCNPQTGRCVPEADSTPCPDTDGTICSIAGCEPTAPGADTAVCAQDHVVADASTPCEDTDGIDCTTAGCDGAGTCDQRHIENCGGCRLTGGGVTPDGGVDFDDLAEHITGRFGGQVGAPCGCIGCFDEFDHVQGNWQYTRKKQKGNFHAKDYNSLICACDGEFDGRLCNPGEKSKGDGLGPEPRPAPANMACFSGVGEWTYNPGNRTDRVAFRVEVEDRGEPGVGDVMRIRIWIPQDSETPEGLADRVCCTIAAPDIRPPDVDDGGGLTHGNLQIHPVLPNTERGRCPPPRGSCQVD